jgi:hypothetical protein
VVIDRFHVAQKYHDAADKVRKKELKRLKEELPEAEFKKLIRPNHQLLHQPP